MLDNQSRETVARKSITLLAATALIATLMPVPALAEALEEATPLEQEVSPAVEDEQGQTESQAAEDPAVPEPQQDDMPNQVVAQDEPDSIPEALEAETPVGEEEPRDINDSPAPPAEEASDEEAPGTSSDDTSPMVESETALPTGAQNEKTLSTLSESTTAASTETAELAKVQKRFPNATVLEATNGNFYNQLAQAKKQASAGPVIVHATGAINSSAREIARNVILVGEKSTVYTFSGSDSSGQNVFRLAGSIYGGTIKGAKKNDDIRVNGTTGDAVNGTISNVTFKGGKYAITAYNSASGIVVTNCTIRATTDCGIQAVNGATYKLIDRCTITNCGESGIDLIFANAKTISNNTITGSRGHGISTDSETKVKNKAQAGCVIGSITNNRISGSSYHGIYLEARCTANSITGNTIYGNKRCGICATAAGVAKAVSQNKIYGNSLSNITVSGKKAKVVLGASNALYKSKEHGLSVSEGGSVTIKGANNRIYSNALHGINVSNTQSVKTVVNVTGAGTKVCLNKKSNIGVFGKKSRFSARKALQSYGAREQGISIVDAQVTLSGAKTIIRNNKKGGIGVQGKGAKLAITGKKSQVKSNGGSGISLSGKASATLKNTTFSGNKGLAVYVGSGCRISYKSTNLSKSAKAKNRVHIA